LAADEVLDFGEELGGVAEPAVDGGETEEGDFVEFFELVEDLAADDGGGDFAFVLGFDLVEDVVDEQVELGIGDGAFDGGVGDGGAELGFVEVFVATVALEDAQGGFDDFLVGGEAVAAAGADAAAADDIAVADGAGIDHFVVGLGTLGAAHGPECAGGGGGSQARRVCAQGMWHDACFLEAGWG